MPQLLALVALLVRDYEEALAWFVGRLGFVPVEDRPVPEQGKRWVVIAPPGGRPGCHLLLARASTPEQQAQVGRQAGGRVCLFLETDDLARDHARWLAAGVRFLEAPRQEAYGTVVVFEDCYGNRWDLVQPARGSAAGGPLGQVRAGYDRWAAVYDHDANPLLALEEPAVRAALGELRGVRALDLGTGTGRHALWMAAAGAEVHALDFSEGMLAQARAKPGAGQVRFLAHDLRQPLPFPDGHMDVVVSGLVLEHLERLQPFFDQVFRVLRPGGRAVLSAMHPAMFLRGSQARFTDPASGLVVQPGSIAHPVGAFALAATRAGFQLRDLVEQAPDEALAAAVPRAARYVGWPMLVVLVLDRPGPPGPT